MPLAYAQHLRELAPRLSPELHALSQISLHDAICQAFSFDKATHRITLVLRCGDASLGNFDLSLCYEEASLRDTSADGLSVLLDDTQSELLYDELDEYAGGFEHRMIFWPEGEVAVRFTALSFRQRNVASRYAP